jgi:hypothetical protein
MPPDNLFVWHTFAVLILFIVLYPGKFKFCLGHGKGGAMLGGGGGGGYYIKYFF